MCIVYNLEMDATIDLSKSAFSSTVLTFEIETFNRVLFRGYVVVVHFFSFRSRFIEIFVN